MPAPPLSAATDAHLMTRVASGDVSAFEVIYDRHKIQAYSLARRIAGRIDGAEEATQDAFLAIWRNAARYDADRGSLRTWILTHVRNRSIDLLRRERPRVVAGEWSDAVLANLPAPGGTEEQVLADEDARRAQRLVGRCPRRSARSSSSPTSAATPSRRSRRARAFRSERSRAAPASP